MSTRTDLMKLAAEMDSLDRRTAAGRKVNNHMGPYTIPSPAGREHGITLTVDLDNTEDVWKLGIDGSYGVSTQQDLDSLERKIDSFLEPIRTRVALFERVGFYPRFSGMEVCEICGKETTLFDHDLNSFFCKVHVQKPGSTTDTATPQEQKPLSG